MEKQRLVEELVIGVFLKLKLDGYCDEISLKDNELQEAASKLEEVFIQNGFDDTDLFFRSSVDKTCDYFRTFLINRFERTKLGKFNSEDIIITIVDNPFVLTYILKKLINYDDILTQACNALTKDIIEVSSTLETIKVMTLKMEEDEWYENSLPDC